MVPRREEPGIAESLTPCPFQAHGHVASAPRAACCACSRSSRTPTDGMRADEVAEALGKSTSTAYNLLDTPLPGGLRGPRPRRRLPPRPPRRPASCRRTAARDGARRPRRPARRALRALAQAGLPRGGALRAGRHPARPRPSGHAAHARARHAHRLQRPRARARQGRARRCSTRAALDRYIERGLRPLHAAHDHLAGRAARAARRHPRRRGRLRPRGVRRGLLLSRQARRRRRAAAPSPRSGCRCPSRCFDTEREALAGGADGRRVQGLGGPQRPRGSSDLGRHRSS